MYDATYFITKWLRKCNREYKLIFLRIIGYYIMTVSNLTNVLPFFFLNTYYTGKKNLNNYSTTIVSNIKTYIFIYVYISRFVTVTDSYACCDIFLSVEFDWTLNKN